MDAISLFRLKADDRDHEQGAVETILYCESFIIETNATKKNSLIEDIHPNGHHMHE